MAQNEPVSSLFNGKPHWRGTREGEFQHCTIHTNLKPLRSTACTHQQFCLLTTRVFLCTVETGSLHSSGKGEIETILHIFCHKRWHSDMSFGVMTSY